MLTAKPHYQIVIVLSLLLISFKSFSANNQHQVTVQWFGQSAIRITTPQGKNILIDPYLTANPKTPVQYKNLSTLGKIDLVLVTHAHFDHLGDTPTILKSCDCKLVAPSGLEDNLSYLGLVDANKLVHMNKTGTIYPFDGVSITMVHAEHSSELDWFDVKTNKHQVLYGGEPVGFIITINNQFTIYHMGDTGLFSDMALIGQYYHPDLILIPIGGNFTMGPNDAAYATNNWLKPKFALPIHYGTYPVLKGTPEEYKKSLINNTTEVIHLQPGESTTFNF
jgi:L-ascorbate metabolism protein UlaG (beta-lactamase superfamily)